MGVTWAEIGGIALAVLVFVAWQIGLPMLKERRAGLATVSSFSGYAMPWMIRYAQPAPAPRSKKVMSTKQKRETIKRHQSRLKQRKARSIPTAYQANQAAQTSEKIPPTTSPQLDIKAGDLTDKQIPVVRKMLERGFSANEVFTLLRGDRATRLAQLREQGILTSDEFEAQKRKLLS